MTRKRIDTMAAGAACGAFCYARSAAAGWSVCATLGDSMSPIKTIVAAMAAALALAGSARADEETIGYNLARGTCTKPIAVPANLKPVILAGTTIQQGDGGDGQVTLLRYNNATPNYLLWTGMDHYQGVDVGTATTGSAVIMYLDAVGYVTVQSAASTHIQVCNSGSNDGGPNAVGYLTFFY
jgi:hypothetical protein